MLVIPQNRQAMLAMTDAGLVQPVAWRHKVTSVPVVGVGLPLVAVSSILVNAGRDGQCPALARCSFSLFLDPNARTQAKVAVGVAPPPMTFSLWGAIGGQWMQLKGFLWAPVDWVDPGLVWWQGGLVEGFAIAGKVDAGAGAFEMSIGVRWLADRLCGMADTGGVMVGGPHITVQ